MKLHLTSLSQAGTSVTIVVEGSAGTPSIELQAHNGDNNAGNTANHAVAVSLGPPYTITISNLQQGDYLLTLMAPDKQFVIDLRKS
jgi:hypothetical protein